MGRLGEGKVETGGGGVGGEARKGRGRRRDGYGAREHPGRRFPRKVEGEAAEPVGSFSRETCASPSVDTTRRGVMSQRASTAATTASAHSNDLWFTRFRREPVGILIAKS